MLKTMFLNHRYPFLSLRDSSNVPKSLENGLLWELKSVPSGGQHVEMTCCRTIKDTPPPPEVHHCSKCAACNLQMCNLRGAWCTLQGAWCALCRILLPQLGPNSPSRTFTHHPCNYSVFASRALLYASHCVPPPMCPHLCARQGLSTALAVAEAVWALGQVQVPGSQGEPAVFLMVVWADGCVETQGNLNQSSCFCWQFPQLLSFTLPSSCPPTVPVFWGMFCRHRPILCMESFLVALIQPVYACERMIMGNFIKHNNNSGQVHERVHERNTPQAFSHFTYVHSGEKYMIVDIQGVDDVYTDPQVHSADGRAFGMGNLGQEGINKFFKTHRCNNICTGLGLLNRDRKQHDTAGTRYVPRNKKEESDDEW